LTMLVLVIRYNMAHNTLDIPFNLFVEKYDSYHVELNRSRFLVRKDRKADLSQQVRDFSRVYLKAKAQENVFYQSTVVPIWDTIKQMDDGQGVILHVETDKESEYDENWKEYFFNKNEYLGYSHSYKWIAEPLFKQNLELGKRFHESNKKLSFYNRREHILKGLFESVMNDLVYSKWDYKWLKEDRYRDTGKIVKIVVDNHNYWYRIEYTRHRHPIWKCFVWQDTKVETIDL
jgi:hypothetical protein